MGSSLAPRKAGTTPATTPTEIETTTAMIRIGIEMLAGITIALRTAVRMAASAIPMAPPSRQMEDDSNRN